MDEKQPDGVKSYLLADLANHANKTTYKLIFLND